jgi:hypothetical protein
MAKEAGADKTSTKPTPQGEGATAPFPQTAGEFAETVAEDTEANGDLVGKVAIAGVIAVGAALIEASLIPGIIIGAAAVLAPKVLPKVGTHLRPLFKSTIRGAYKLTESTREVFAEAQEHVQDIMAEARQDEQEDAAAPKSVEAGDRRP